MDDLLLALRALAEPTRLRVVALAAAGGFCVMDFSEILGQSQPRLSRHLRLLHEAGLLERAREGSNVWLNLPPPASPLGSLVRSLLERLPEDDPVLAADRRQAARVLAERAREATEGFRRTGAEWDEMRALDLPAAEVERVLLAAMPAGPVGRLLDIGTGTGRLLEVLGPRARAAIGLDASRGMLALARARLAGAAPALAHCTVRLGDMYRLPMPDRHFNVVVMHMVLHHAEDPRAAVTEAARVLADDGTLLLVDLAAHADTEAATRLAHRWPGFGERRMRELLEAAGLTPAEPVVVPGRLEVRLWSARAAAAPTTARPVTVAEERA
jgi:ArsR family transcriptional regulator